MASSKSSSSYCRSASFLLIRFSFKDDHYKICLANYCCYIDLTEMWKKSINIRPFNEGRGIACARANTRPKMIDEAIPERLIARPGGRLLGCVFI